MPSPGDKPDENLRPPPAQNSPDSLRPAETYDGGILRWWQAALDLQEAGFAAARAQLEQFTSFPSLSLRDAPIGILELDDSLLVRSSNLAADTLIGVKVSPGTPLDQVLPRKNVASIREQMAASPSDSGSFATTIELPPSDAGASFPVPIRLDVQRLNNRSGSVATLTRQSLAALPLISNARTRMVEICAREHDPEALLRAVLDELQKIVPFDIATYYEHAAVGDDEVIEDPELSRQIRRMRFAFDPQRPDFKWPMRWLSLPKVVDAWTRNPPSVMHDLDEFIARLPEAGAFYLRRHPSTQAAQHAGLRSFLYFPLFEGDTVLTALSIASRRPFQYGSLHWEAICTAGLEQVLEFVNLAYTRRSENFSRRVETLFQSHAGPKEIANEFVSEIAEEFRWEYVGIFRVVRSRGCFQLVAQQDRIGEPTVDETYEQELKEGALGWALKQGRPLRISDVDADGQHFGYIKLNEKHKSCLCFPIAVGPNTAGPDGPAGNIEWILDCESTQRAAFAKPDEYALENLIGNLQTTLELWFEAQLNASLLGFVKQGVAVASAEGKIERMNAKARQLFGLSEGQNEERHLEACGADVYSQEILRQVEPVENRRLSIRGVDHIERRVLGSSSLSSEAFGRWIWLFTDTAEQEWLANLHYARATVEQVAAQARGSLILASVLIKQLGNVIARSDESDATVTDILPRIVKSLGKADLTYERLAQAMAGRAQVDLRQLLDGFVAALLIERQVVIRLHQPVPAVDVFCNSNQACQALVNASIHLVEPQHAIDHIFCTVAIRETYVAILLTTKPIKAAEVAQATASDILTQVDAAARFAVSLPVTAQKQGNALTALEQARWDLLDEGGDVIETNLPEGGAQVEVRLQRAIVPQRAPNG